MSTGPAKSRKGGLEGAGERIAILILTHTKSRPPACQETRPSPVGPSRERGGVSLLDPPVPPIAKVNVEPARQGG